ncbi:MAG: glycosyl transferase, partial [Xanthomonadales bacterium]|nr:glycosyl transferase [Xanthomonadales bacterium]
KALARARAGYVIFSDGDCIPHRKFIEEHLHWRAPGHFLVGRLAYLSEAYSRSIDEDDVLAGKLEGINVTLVRDALRGEGKALGHSFYIGNRL